MDLYTGFSPHTGDQLHPETFQKIEPKRTSNFVNADGYHLPFKDGAFEEVYSSHLIEHMTSPFIFLKELSRVTKVMGNIEIRCPHKYARGRREMIHHVSKLDGGWFRAAAEKLRLGILTLNVTWMPIGFRIGFFHVRPFAKPWDIQVVMRKTLSRT